MKYIQNTVNIWCILAGLFCMVAGLYATGALGVLLGFTAILSARGIVSDKETSLIFFVFAGLLALTLYSAGYLIFAVAFLVHSIAMLIIFILEVIPY